MKIPAAAFVLLLLVACAPAQQTGRAVLGITDAAADMGAVTSVTVTIDTVRLHNTNGTWTDIDVQAHDFDLLDLKAQGTTAVLADAQVPLGSYDQIRLEISKVLVTDADGEHEAKLPSNELKLMGELDVTANATTAATFDFVADESLHLTGNGLYIMAPVVHVETRNNADASVDARGNVEIRGGSVKTDIKVGMDEHGAVAVGAHLPDDASIDIEDGQISVHSKARVQGIEDGLPPQMPAADVDAGLEV